MADDVDLVINAVRGIGQGARGLGQTIQGLREEDARNAELQRKRDTERIAEERTGQLVSEMEEAEVELDELGEDATMDDFARLTAKSGRTATQIGRPDLLRSFDARREAILEREKKSRANIAAGRAAEVEKKESERKKRKETDEVREMFKKDKGLQAARTVQKSFNNINTLASKPSSGPRDTALVIETFKSLDPGSTVREGEFNTLKDARAAIVADAEERGLPIPAALDDLFRRLNPEKKGAFLQDNQVEELRSLSENSYRNSLESITDFESLMDRRIAAGELDEKQIIDFRPSSELARLEKMRQAREAEQLGIQRDQAPTVKISPEQAAKVFDAIEDDPKFQASKAAFEQKIGRALTDDELAELGRRFLKTKKNQVIGGQ